MRTAVALLLICTMALAENPASYFPVLQQLDTLWGLNFTESIGPASEVCACQDLGNNTFSHCAWTRITSTGVEGFFCVASGLPSNGTLASILFFDSDITGTIPSEISQLTTLKNLLLRNVSISGSLPSELATLPDLAQITVRRTKINGTIPDQYGNMPALTKIDFGSNSLTGAIPDFSSSILQQLLLNDNNFTSISGLPTSLTSLTLSNNNISGLLPNLTNPMVLSYMVDNNHFTGPTPIFLASAPINVGSCSLSSNDIDECAASNGRSNVQFQCLVSCRPTVNNTTTPPPTTQPVCTYPAPTALAACLDGSWIILGDFVDGVLTLFNTSLTINGDFKPATTSVVVITQGQVLTVTGTAVLSGTIVIDGIETLSDNTPYPIITAGQITGNFTQVNVSNLPNCKVTTLRNSGTTLSILISPDTSCQAENGKSGLTKVHIAAIVSAVGVLLIVSVIVLGIVFRRKIAPCVWQKMEETGGIR